ncbi:hypothetical protein ID866_1737 [Astraeus odoratus]|nr:hypothetical protein ID866_1737 [Astraeus odoratus]
MSKPLLLYTAPTPNGHRVSIVLEELRAAYGTNVVDYDVERVNLSARQQKEPSFIALNPNGRIPVLVDRAHKPAPFNVFESAAILLYVTRKYDTEGRFTFPVGSDDESEMLQWIFFAHGGVGPMQREASWFRRFVPEDIPYAKKRFTEETARLYGVLNIRLEGRDYLVGPGRGKLSIADLNVFPWVILHARAGIDTMDEFPNVKAWLDRIAERPAVKAGLAIPQSQVLRTPVEVGMTDLRVSTAYICAATNRFNRAASLSPDATTIAFGSARLVALWNIDDPNDNGIYETLPGHEGTVTCVQFLYDDLFFSADDRGVVRAWRKVENTWRCTLTSEAHKQPISALTALDDVLVTGSSDSSIKVWNIKHGEMEVVLEESQTIPLQGRYPLAIAATTMPKSKAIILAIAGHEAGVTSLSWASGKADQSDRKRSLTLLSTSTDSSLILWSPSDTLFKPISSAAGPSIWINRQRFGDVGGQRLGGFVGGIWAHTARGDEALAWGWSGGWRRWRSIRVDAMDGNIDSDEWREVGAIGGHNAPVKDVDWSPAGEYLISVSLDQTTRIHGAVFCATSKIWHELARPQVHGYDLVGAVWLSPWKFASVADEKVVRVFEAPGGFVETVKSLSVDGLAEVDQDRPVAASVPPLGLSNKATNDTPPQLDPTYLRRRPFEGELASMTLWPEVAKVFGHGYESITIASSHSRELLATACRATSSQHAVVRVYSASTFQLFGSPLEGHTLTVTRIAFSPNDDYVVTCGRADQSGTTWQTGYVPVAMDKSHARIIWDCAWSSESDIFATASRDKTVKIWTLKSGSDHWPALATLKFKEAATAVAFCSIDDTR